jgi:hypothetical protein
MEMTIVRKDSTVYVEIGDLLRPVTHGELVKLLKLKSVSRRSRTPEGKVSRQVTLYHMAITTGRWSNGAVADRQEHIDKLRSLLIGVDRCKLTAVAKSKLEALDTMGVVV